MGNIVFVDTETTSLDPLTGEIWDLALVWEDEGVEWTFIAHLQPMKLYRADPDSLRIGRYHTRTVDWSWDDPRTVAAEVARITEGRHIAGMVPGFDIAFLDPFLREKGFVPAWHYQPIDVEVLAAGWLNGRRVPPAWTPPYDSELLSRAVGVDPSTFERHTALGDARWAKAVYEAVTR